MISTNRVKFFMRFNFYKVVRILKKRAQEMSCSSKVSRTFEFLRIFGAAKKIQAKVSELLRKIKKKLKLTALASQQSSLVLSQ